ncbi:MAG: RAMP superfamily CRISPR-associated protein, partial [Desulfurococcales archaeon]|nr:RAMP superfamily CRISPR-associated protein [Desulfurococcales archaeon]
MSVLTPLHPGAGRSPGVVDLPIIRDSMNYPFIPGSELKGALKTLLGRKSNTISNGKIDCKRKPEL